MATAFTFYEKFGDAAAFLDRERQDELFAALVRYGLYGEAPEGADPAVAALFTMMADDIDHSKKAREKGGKGGRPRKPLVEQVSEKEKPGVSEMGKPQVSENEKPGVSAEPAKNENPIQNNTKQCNTRQVKRGAAFAAPAQGDVEAYMGEYLAEKARRQPRFNPRCVDPVSMSEHFCNYFQQRGWTVGKANAPMRDWKAAARNWALREVEAAPNAEKEVWDGGADCIEGLWR